MTPKQQRLDLPLKNARHEAVARNLAEGMSENDAYAAAGYKSNRSHASRLVANGNIQARVAFLQSQAAERAVVTVEDIVRQLDADRSLARERGLASAAVQATMGKAKVLGLIVNRHVVGAKRLEDMNKDELQALLGVLEAEEGRK